MRLIDIILRIGVVYMIVMIPASIIQLMLSIYLHDTGYCISVLEAVGILVCTFAWWVFYLKIKQLHR